MALDNMISNKDNLARLALVEAFRRGELTFQQMERKGKIIGSKLKKTAKKKASAKTP